jgi:hypothetical protein
VFNEKDVGKLFDREVVPDNLDLKFVPTEGSYLRETRGVPAPLSSPARRAWQLRR